MPVNSQIPLQVQQPQFMTPFEGMSGAQTIQQQMQSTQLNQQKLAAGQHELNNQMLLSRIAAVPGSIDPATGLWSQTAIDSIVQANPVLGRDILQKQTKDKMAIEQLSLQKNKNLAAMHKAGSDAINDEQLDAVGAADAAPAEKREEVYAAKWAEGRARLKKTGLFSEDTQFADMSYKQAKEILLRRGGKEDKNAVQDVANARDIINDLKTEYSHLDSKSPQAAQIMEKIRDGEEAIKRMKAMPGGENKEPSNIQTARILLENKNNPDFINAFKMGKSSADPVGVTASALYKSYTDEDMWPSEIEDASQDEKVAYVRKLAGALHNKESGVKKDEVVTRFEGDKDMEGMVLGKKTAKGYEVMRGGKLAGYYQ